MGENQALTMLNFRASHPWLAATGCWNHFSTAC